MVELVAVPWFPVRWEGRPSRFEASRCRATGLDQRTGGSLIAAGTHVSCHHGQRVFQPRNYSDVDSIAKAGGKDTRVRGGLAPHSP